MVEKDISDYDFEGAITTRRRIADIVSEVGKFRPLRLLRERKQITLRYQVDEAAVLMPSDESAYISRPVVRTLALESRRSLITVRYRPGLRENEASQEILERVGGAGAASEFDLPFVYEKDTADGLPIRRGSVNCR